MYYDLQCPYCDKEQNVNHDDGFGYEEDTLHQMQCCGCDKEFVFTTSISYYHESEKADCLNDGEHNYKAQCCFPKEFTQMQCTMCGDLRKPTEEEMIEILK